MRITIVLQYSSMYRLNKVANTLIVNQTQRKELKVDRLMLVRMVFVIPFKPFINPHSLGRLGRVISDLQNRNELFSDVQLSVKLGEMICVQ